MRVAVSGSHGTGKSTLIAAFLERCPEYAHEPEAFEVLGDDVELAGDEGPTADGLRLLLAHTVSTLDRCAPGASVVFERSPVDYLAYAIASRSWARGSAAAFLEESLPLVRRSLGHLDLIAFLPVAPGGPAVRPGEDPRFRKRVDRALTNALLDDEYDLLGEAGSPLVVALPTELERRVAELIRSITMRRASRRGPSSVAP
jgi:predicted ATPase